MLIVEQMERKLNLKKLVFILIAIGCIIYHPAFAQGYESWSYNLNIYEVNTRQYTSSGTFVEFAEHLDRLEEMGVGIIWFMPVHPIGLENRLGSLGSPYSVKNYMEINPEFGTIDEFKSLVDSIHAKGMYVIIDWVGNHTSWDNVLTETHPEWYVTDDDGNFISPPGTNWSDVIQLDHSKPELLDYMVDAMTYWVSEAGVDGFRWDAVSFIPHDFMSELISQMRTVRNDLLMLAEGDSRQYQFLGFDMSYAWGLHGFGNGVLKRIVNGTNNAEDLDTYIGYELLRYLGEHNRLYFTSNHDENAWYGTVFEQFGDAAESFAVLTGTINGMQLVYGGQEAGLNKRLAFFDKDEIIWNEHPFQEMYTSLNNLKKENKALWNGSFGGDYKRVTTSDDQNIFAFIRENEEDKIFAIFNFTDVESEVYLFDTLHQGIYTNVFTGDTLTFTDSSSITLDGWGYNLYEKVNPPTKVQSDDKTVYNYYLFQNYPNPFNPSTTINFSIPRTSVVSLKVYNMLGQEIAELINKQMSSGNYTVNFNAENLSSGIYLYSIQSGDFYASKKMLLVK